jgi:hypothetical protein
MEKNSWLLLHDNAPAHRSLLIKDWLTKNDMNTQKPPPYFPDLVKMIFTCSLDKINIERKAFL